MNEDVERWPIDFDSLSKGTWIEGEVLEGAITGLAKDPDNFAHRQFAIMRLVQMIKDQTDFVAYEDHGRIRVATDAEAAAYTERMFRRHMGGMIGQLSQRAKVDPSGFNAEERRRFDHETLRQAAIVAAARTANKRQRLATVREPKKLG